MNEEGVIKFTGTWIKKEPVNAAYIKDINEWRDKLYSTGFIGVTPDGIGYGNMSMRYQNNQFIITGSGTGKFKKLTHQHYTVVTDFDITENRLTAAGPVIASSESLTHAMVYKCDKEVNAVFHVHHAALWEKLLKTHPATNKTVAYGTPEMAREIIRLFSETTLSKTKLFAMAGHQDGIVSFGRNADEAGEILLDQLSRV